MLVLVYVLARVGDSGGNLIEVGRFMVLVVAVEEGMECWWTGAEVTDLALRGNAINK